MEVDVVAAFVVVEVDVAAAFVVVEVDVVAAFVVVAVVVVEVVVVVTGAGVSRATNLMLFSSAISSVVEPEYPYNVPLK